MSRPRAPVLIQRELLLEDDQRPAPARIEEVVAYQRRGRRLLLLAEQPARWRPTRNAVDRDLALQQSLHQLIRRAGAELDGVLYLATGLFTRRQVRLDELDQLAARYRVSSGELILIATEPVLIESMVRAGGRALVIGAQRQPGASNHASLQQALEALS